MEEKKTKAVLPRTISGLNKHSLGSREKQLNVQWHNHQKSEQCSALRQSISIRFNLSQGILKRRERVSENLNRKDYFLKS